MSTIWVVILVWCALSLGFLLGCWWVTRGLPDLSLDDALDAFPYIIHCGSAPIYEWDGSMVVVNVDGPEPIGDPDEPEERFDWKAAGL